MEKHVLGHIDCPTCGAAGGMRITHDKNQEPFGYCEAGCGQQLRVGGNPARVRMFVSRNPFAAKSGAAIPVTVTVTETVPGKTVPTLSVMQENPVTVTVPKQEQKPKRKATFADALGVLGVQ